MRRESQPGHDQALHDARANVLLQLAVLAGTLCGQQDLQHHAKAGERTVGVGKSEPSLTRLITERLRPDRRYTKGSNSRPADRASLRCQLDIIQLDMASRANARQNGAD